MGLDVYLRTAAQAAANRRYDQAAGELYGRDDYESLPEETLRELDAGLPPYIPATDVPSHRHPDHLFGRRYLRSSYNPAGWDNAVPQLLAAPNDVRGTLAWILGADPTRHETELTDGDLDRLRDAKARAILIAQELRHCDRLRVLTVGHNPFLDPPKVDPTGALRIYRDAVTAGRVTGGQCWESRDLAVLGDGVTILAAVPGLSALGAPAVHLVTRSDDEEIDWCVAGAEVIAEFCDEAIELVETDGSCLMTWSA